MGSAAQLRTQKVKKIFLRLRDSFICPGLATLDYVPFRSPDSP
jgi:hypothetical protein